MTKFFMSFDAAVQNTGIAYFKVENTEKDIGYAIESTKNIIVWKTEKVSLPKNLKAEKASIEMVKQLIKRMHEEKRVDGIICEIQKPHGDAEVMSMQAFAHLTTIPITLLGFASFWGIETYCYTPQTWKGSVKKEVMTKRLYDNEILNLTNPNLFSLKDHDILDAIGLGRYHFKNQEYLRRTGR